MDEYGSTEAAFAIAGLKTDVTTWSYPNCFVDDRFLFLNDCLSLGYYHTIGMKKSELATNASSGRLFSAALYLFFLQEHIW